MKRSALIAVTALICISQSALAEDSGFYLGAGVASGKLSACDNTTDTCNNFTASSQDHTHLRLIGGYDFNKYIGIEAGVSGLGTYKVQNTTGTVVASVKSSAVTLAAKGGYVFPHGFSIFGKLGLASVKNQYTAEPGWTITGNADQRSTGLLMGLGGQYNFNNTVGLRLFTELIAYKDDGYTGAVGGTTLMAVVKF
jgi:OmpA-OmpF porin, OOP family